MLLATGSYACRSRHCKTIVGESRRDRPEKSISESVVKMRSTSIALMNALSSASRYAARERP